jgi:hypothetical protein
VDGHAVILAILHITHICVIQPLQAIVSEEEIRALEIHLQGCGIEHTLDGIATPEEGMKRGSSLNNK